MALRYDFDMVAVTPEGLPDQFGDLALTGITAEKVAMFRDPDTVAALKSADTAVRTYFMDSGFALAQFDSGAPAGHFAMRDEDARIAVIDRLTSNLETHDLANAAWGGFDFDAFMDALATAEPVEDALLAPQKSGPLWIRNLRLHASRPRKRRAAG
ncbi:hypothetical protein QTO30_16460 [Yoonia sp. GPGPB17]|uniref:hypothetical protein n=1 Tax=Yoonia sp. GPGPB17 TaxID=3026147 RepID=UPI0030BCD5FC